MSDELYRALHFQIKYRKDLNVIAEEDITKETVANHFLLNGYEHLYIQQDGRIVNIITFDDFLKDNYQNGLDRVFVVNSSSLNSKTDISHFFIDNLDVDRISVIDNGELICEIDSLIEIPLQNGLAKNLMSLRYVDYFKAELEDYFLNYRRVLLIANEKIKDFFECRFKNVLFDNAETLNTDKDPKEYDIVIDFVYCSNIRRILGYKPVNLISMSWILTRYAIKRLSEYCLGNGIELKFYKIQKYENLTCLNEREYNNAIKRIKTGLLIKEGSYFKDYKVEEDDYLYLKRRTYHASLRLDNGYCFIQDNCNNEFLNVQNGCRSTGKNVRNYKMSQKVLFFGPCTTYGFLVPDYKTIPAIVQDYICLYKNDVVVENYAGIHGYNELNAIMQAMNTPVKKGDVIVIFDALDDLEIDEYPNAKFADDWFNKDKCKDETLFFDFPGHCGYAANGIIAKHIFEDIKDFICYSLDKNTKKPERIIKDYEPYELLDLTHSTNIKFYNNYVSRLFAVSEQEIIGAVILEDVADSSCCFEILEKASNYCDKLYAFAFNVDLTDVDCHKDLFSEESYCINGKAVKVFQLGYFYNYQRYLYEDIGASDSSEKIYFIENCLNKSIFRKIGVNTRFITETDVVYRDLIERSCAENSINIVHI